MVGDAYVLEDALRFSGFNRTIRSIGKPEEAVGEPGTIECVDLHALAPEKYQYGQVSAACGEAAFQYVVKAIEYAQAGRVAGVVTAPINKEALHLAGHYYSGHTEIFADYTHTPHYAMLLMSGKLRVIHCTTHVSMGRSWSYRPAPFPPIGYAQRCCLLRLFEEAIVFFSFTDPQYDLKSGNIRGMDLTDAHGEILHGYGLYAAVSFDEGATWPVQRLITTAKPPQEYDPGASCPTFVMDKTHAQPQGYMQAVQAPDGMIHLISSRLHYRFNLPWLMSGHSLGQTE
ncbi:MAG: 4-hydroxythreonine-4-phosphate dehydrogenase PdxA [Clostridiales bacterium]|nr:4-hydroxythreonine-4-phosphate dehydrogenase PdxA [Clostridiales bacterium]